MSFVSVGTIGGLLRSDGTTSRTITMNRTSTKVKNGFHMRESGVDPDMAQTIIYSAVEMRGLGGRVIRHQTITAVWPYDVAAAPGVKAGEVIYNKNGLHVPINCPDNTRKDIRQQLSALASSAVGTVGYQLLYQPLLGSDFPV